MVLVIVMRLISSLLKGNIVKLLKPPPIPSLILNIVASASWNNLEMLLTNHSFSPCITCLSPIYDRGTWNQSTNFSEIRTIAVIHTSAQSNQDNWECVAIDVKSFSIYVFVWSESFLSGVKVSRFPELFSTQNLAPIIEVVRPVHNMLPSYKVAQAWLNS